MKKYNVSKHYRENMERVFETDDFREAVKFCLEEDLSPENGHAVSIWKNGNSVFEINYYGNVELDIDKCITKEELLLLAEYDLISDVERELEMIVADECMCAGCQERRLEKGDVSLEDRLVDAQGRVAGSEETGKSDVERALDI